MTGTTHGLTKVLPKYLPAGIKQNHQNLSHDIQWLNQNS